MHLLSPLAIVFIDLLEFFIQNFVMHCSYFPARCLPFKVVFFLNRNMIFDVVDSANFCLNVFYYCVIRKVTSTLRVCKHNFPIVYPKKTVLLLILV